MGAELGFSLMDSLLVHEDESGNQWPQDKNISEYVNRYE